VRLIDLEPNFDQRGFFARTFCNREFAEYGLCSTFVQQSLSQTTRRGTIRGMHFQRGSAAEVKVVSCVRGAIFDVVIDLIKGSPTFGSWQGFELTAENRSRLYIPAGMAHGFQTLTDGVEVEYLMSEYYSPGQAFGIRHDDPAFEITWPLLPTMISTRDQSWPDFDISRVHCG
jgi:dTDP-4-dehydrorhamnose 3,5-epimerase